MAPSSDLEGASLRVSEPGLPREASRRARGRRRASRHSPHGLLRGLGIFLIVLIALLAVGDYGYREYRRLETLVSASSQDFRTGQQQLEAGKSSLRLATSSHDATKIQTAKASFTAAAMSFRRARNRIDRDPSVARASTLPEVSIYVAPRLRAVDGLADMGVAVSQAALDGADIDALLMSPGAGSTAGARLLSTLKLAAPQAGKVKQDLVAAQAAAEKVDPSLLPKSESAAFVSARSTITTGLASIDEFNRLIPVMLEVMGANGPRTYLIQQLNPAELRPGGGFFGTYSLMSANDGDLTVSGGGSSIDQTRARPTVGQRGYVQPPGPLRELITNDSWTFPDSNFFPDFASNAQQAQTFLAGWTGAKTDGVIAIDIYAISALLALTGPVHVASENATFDSSNFIPTLIKRDVAGDATHKVLVAEVAGPLLARISTIPTSQWPGLITTLNTLAAQRHLQAFFNNAAAETEMGNIGWSGGIQSTNAQDYVYPVEANLGGTKANYFLVRKYTLALTANGTELHHQLTIAYEDDSSLPNTNYYSCYLRLLVSPDSSRIAAQGLRADKYGPPEVPAGLKMVDGWFSLSVGSGGKGTAQVVLSWDGPVKPDAAGDQQIYWQKQPGLGQDALTVTFTIAGKTGTATSDMAQDRKIILTSSGAVSIVAGQAGSAHLPGLSL